MILVKWGGRRPVLITTALRSLSSKNVNDCFESPVKAPKEEAKEDTPHKTINKKEINGPQGKEPTRYGDWERKGRVSDF